MHIHRLSEELRRQGLEGMAERVLTERPSLAAIEARLRDLGYRELGQRVKKGDFDGD